jgi:Holliday junction resolvasome RuvABC endonuclease subunit
VKLLALDLGGAIVGWATLGPDPPYLASVGAWSISDRNRKESPGVRWIRLRQKLDEALVAGRPDLCVYEEVRAHMAHVPEKLSAGGEKVKTVAVHLRRQCYDLPLATQALFRPILDELDRAIATLKQPPAMNTDAAHAYGAAEGILLAWCAENGLEVKSQPIASVKAAATGKGGGPGTGKEEVLAAARVRWGGVHAFPGYDAADAAFIGLAALIELGMAPATGRADGLPSKGKAVKAAPVRRSGNLF